MDIYTMPGFIQMHIFVNRQKKQKKNGMNLINNPLSRHCAGIVWHEEETEHMAEHSKTIYIRHGLNGFPYAAYTENWRFIANFRHLRDARKHWQKEIKLGLVRLVRDL